MRYFVLSGEWPCGLTLGMKESSHDITSVVTVQWYDVVVVDISTRRSLGTPDNVAWLIAFLPVRHRRWSECALTSAASPDGTRIFWRAERVKWGSKCHRFEDFCGFFWSKRSKRIYETRSNTPYSTTSLPFQKFLYSLLTGNPIPTPSKIRSNSFQFLFQSEQQCLKPSDVGPHS